MIFYEKPLLFANKLGIFTHIVASLFVYRFWMICGKRLKRQMAYTFSLSKTVNTGTNQSTSMKLT